MLSQNRATVNRFPLNVGTKFKFYIIRHILPPPQNDEAVSGPITHPPARRKASPGGEAGATSVATDEVEANDYHHGMVRRCYLRPHPVRQKPDHRSRGMTATGSHIDFGFAARGTTPRGRLFSVPAGFCVDFYRSNIPGWRARHARPYNASPLQCPAGRYLKRPHSRYHKHPPAGGIPLTGGSFYCILSHLCRFRSLFSRF